MAFGYCGGTGEGRYVHLSEGADNCGNPNPLQVLIVAAASLLTFFFNIFFIKGLFFLSYARELACEGEMKCLSNVILTRFYVDVRKCDMECKGSVDLNEN